MTNFYNNLFGIEISLFGIIAASVFVFVQLIYSQFSYREISLILRNIPLLLYFIISTITLLITAMGSFVLSFSYDLTIPHFDICFIDFYSCEYTALSILFLVFTSLFLFVLSITSNIQFIRPYKIALLLGKNIKNEHISSYLMKTYGILDPENNLFFRMRHFSKNVGATNNNAKSTKLDDKNSGKLLRQNKLKYYKLKKKVLNQTNPLEPLNALIYKVINDMDIITFNYIVDVLIKISLNFIETNNNNKDSDDWNPLSGIVDKYMRFYVENTTIYLDLCDRNNFDLAKIKILGATNDILLLLLKRNDFGEINNVFILYKEVGDKSIGKSKLLFTKIIQYYEDAANSAFEKNIIDDIVWLNTVYGHLGWLGERLLSKLEIEEKPIMADDYSNEYDNYFNTMISIGSELSRKHPESYPIIYFDAIQVVFNKLIKTNKTRTHYDSKNNIHNLIYVYYSFAREAIRNGNSNGAAFAVFKLNTCYENLIEEKFQEEIKELTGLLVSLGGFAAGHEPKIQIVDFIGEPIHDYIIKILLRRPYFDVIKGEITELMIKGEGDRKLILAFVHSLGKKMKTNFGIMFDYETGETYSDDDPRRKGRGV